ncbi:hypothetical protein GPL17_23700 [Bradyrhizobium yuanmingense]|uniref:hypothetical protein n=1 Tax=Bradyrhizobium yuanmingense TaxID=108015 RepID=UPI0012F932F0|nr:hypothetical protein [Bradyrhizobium yuanmingense]MDF0496979.1 hypothetical protein [Bradyrhizobium yuanmingense]MVT53479.1 hypothetical protein [Bradyrhizobium yuanmingense]
MVGAFLVVFSVVLLWFFLPRNGQSHQWMALPFFDTGIPKAIVMSFSAGLTMVIDRIC